ncbi:FRG domain-containing protein [Shewanella algae]|uniref:FRG domain-containing protein n=1 Tax=Shewanella algae TaxID=38313 RepID=UPI001BF185D4|nr:FRG domain-containing protein [Shewanella algae]BCV54688.1 FRG domain-containing protein [Shewanella algae]
MEASNLIEYLKCVSNDDCDWFRGQADATWDLIPSIARIKKPKKIGDLTLGSWEEVEETLLEEFEKQAAPFMDFKPENKWELLVHAQHHGLPTTLLDWTTNPLKALFFAVEDPEHDEVNGIVYACVANSYSPTTKNTDKAFQDERINCFQTSHLNNRIIAQEGCFSAYPLPDGFDDFKNLQEHTDENNSDLWIHEEIIIPSYCKVGMRKELRRLGVTHQSLFPRLDGVAKSISRNFE